MKCEAKYLSLQYGSNKNPYCNIHESSGTLQAKSLHYHDFFQIYFVTEGILVHHSDQECIELVAGDCFIIPPFFKHYISVDSSSSVFYSFSFQKAFLQESILRNKVIEELLTMLTPQNIMLKLSLKAEQIHQINNLLSYSLQEFENQAPGWECALQGLLSNILIMFYRTYKVGVASVFYSNSTIQNCITYINMHFKENIKLENILKKFHFSHSSFLRIFRANTGKNFQTYLTECRINYARFLLRETEKTISAICNECGYGDYSAFYRAFYKRTKTSPFKYRSLAKKYETK